jgi:nicotinate-nucleotide adenylyltransferase
VKRVGLLGGSFDPVHQAHLALARAALSELELDQVQFIPAGNPWQRAPLRAAGSHRRRMIELAIAGDPRLAVNPIELERDGPTYTIDTLKALPQDAKYVWLLGADQLANFCTWRQWKEIVRYVDLAVASRPGTSLAAPAELQAWLHDLGRPLLQLPFTPLAISASDIRRRLAGGDSTAGLLPPAVADYIADQGLYQ